MGNIGLMTRNATTAISCIDGGSIMALYLAPRVNLAACLAALPSLDLADEGMWEDRAQELGIEFISLEAAGLEEESAAPVFGGFQGECDHVSGGVLEYAFWFLDGDLGLAE